MFDETKGPYLIADHNQDAMNVVLPLPTPPALDTDVILLGTSSMDNIRPVAPLMDEFTYADDDTLKKLRPIDNQLSIPLDSTTKPPPGKFFPVAPPNGYKLLEDTRYTRGFVYAARYDLFTLLAHRERLLHIAMPPILRTPDNSSLSVPGMIKLVPGVPFVFHFNGDLKRTHTVACVQTLESLKSYADYNEILQYSVQLAKLTWGTPSTATSPEIRPVYMLEGLKTNDRSAARAALQHDTFDGSYSLANTVMKGEGLGTFLPSVQANSAEAEAQIHQILNILHALRRLVMPKCLSKFEHDIFDFHMDYNNVFSFGGLQPGATSVQLNISSIGQKLDSAIGDLQGYWHTDKSDDPQFWTLFILLFRLPPGADPGPFFIARGGLYVHELDIWILFIVFKGTDVHSGVAPTDDSESHFKWSNSTLDAVWSLTGPQNRAGYVNYVSIQPSKRTGCLNASPPVAFGNYGSGHAHKSMQKNFAEHGHVTMGSPVDRATRLAREAISNLYNTMRVSGLTLGIDIDTILQSVQYEDTSTKELGSLSSASFPYHPTKDEALVHKYLSLYRWHLLESHHFNLGITNAMLHAARMESAPCNTASTIDFPDNFEGPFEIQHISHKVCISGKWFIVLRLEGHDTLFRIEQSSPLLSGNAILQAWLSTSVNGLPQPDRIETANMTGTNNLTNPTMSEDSQPPPIPAPDLQSTSANGAHTDQPSQGNTVAVNVPVVHALQSNEGKIVPVDAPAKHVPQSEESNIVAVNGPVERLPRSSDSEGNNVTIDAPAERVPQNNEGNIIDVNAPGERVPRSNATGIGQSTDENAHTRGPPLNDNTYGTPSDTSRESGDSDRDEEVEKYEVEAILNHDFSDPENFLWLIKWKGYADNHNSWENGDNLRGSIEVLLEYNRKHGLSNHHFMNVIEATDIVNNKHKVARSNATLEFATNLGQLQDLLNDYRLDDEISGLIFQFRQALQGGREYWSTNVSISSLINTWTTHEESSTDILGTLSIFASDTVSSGILRFKHLQMSLAILPTLASHLHKLDLISRAYQREICRTLITIYDWYTASGPAFCELLISMYRAHGYKSMKATVPLFADFVDHVVQYVYTDMKERIPNPAAKPNSTGQKRKTRKKTSSAPKKRQKTGKSSKRVLLSDDDDGETSPSDHTTQPTNTDLPTPPTSQKARRYTEFCDLPNLLFGETPPILGRMPNNLYGLLSSPKASTTVKLPPIPVKRRPYQSDPVGCLFQASLECLQDVISTFVVHPFLKYIDYSTGHSKGAQNVENTCNRAITRGAILACIYQECNSDGIFASDSIKAFLARPSQDLLDINNHDGHGAIKLKNNRQLVIEPLLDALRAHLKEFSAVAEKATRLGSIVDTHLQAIQNGGVVDHNDETLEPSLFSPKASSSMLITGSDFLMNIDFTSVLSAVPSPKLTILAVILREALNNKRNLPVADEVTHRILLGYHPSQSSTVTYVPCQTNPIRQFSEYASLVRTHLPAQLLATEVGISNLLSWMATGQGYNTKRFLLAIGRPTGFFSNSMHEILDIFQPADSANAALSLQMRTTQSKVTDADLRRLRDYIPCDDQRIWGQPNHLLSLHPTITRLSYGAPQKKTLEQKFAPYWDVNLQLKWINFLGDIANSDPLSSTSVALTRPSWFAALAFFSKLNIPVFGKGLTLLQTVNNLVYANIVEMPSDTDVAIWIHHNRSLGAFTGLQLLGFSMLTSATSVIFAFKSIYDHMNTSLTQQDKDDLGFSPIFLEHALCKVARWSSRLKVKVKSATPLPSLLELGTRAEKTAPPWTKGENIQNHRAFPFPIHINEDQRLLTLKSLTNTS